MWRETVSGSCGTPRRLRPYAEYLPQYKFERQTLNRSMLSNDCIHSGRILPFQARALQVGSRRHRFIGKGSQPESIPRDDTGKLLLQIHVPQSHPVQARICCRSFWNSLFSFSSGVGSCDIAERERGREGEGERRRCRATKGPWPAFLCFCLFLCLCFALCQLPFPWLPQTYCCRRMQRPWPANPQLRKHEQLCWLALWRLPNLAADLLLVGTWASSRFLGL